MPNFEDLYKEVKDMESEIQTMTGQRQAVLSQVAEYESELEKMEQACQRQFGCSLEDLEAKIEGDKAVAMDLYNKLVTHMCTIKEQ